MYTVDAKGVVRSVEDHSDDYPLPRFITYEDYVNDPFLLCTGMGIHIPSYNDAWVRSGSYSTHTTDQGKDTGELTVGDLGSATVFDDGKYKGLTATTSQTYGYYTEATHRSATPAEVYVLAELNDNTPGNGSEFKVTDKEYTGEVQEASYIEVDGVKYYMVEYKDGEPSKYVTKVGDKYYEVEVTNNEGSGNYSAVQVAWWAVSPAQEGGHAEDNSLAKEARDFEDYINALSSGGKWHYSDEEATECAGMTLNKTQIIMHPEDTAQLLLSMEPTNLEKKEITWTTSDKEIATVSSRGVVKAIKRGKRVTVALKEKPEMKAECIVIVQQVIKATGIKLDKTTLTIKVEGSAELKATLEPEDASSPITWSTSDKKIATVENGKVTGVKKGTTTITAKANGHKATCKVTVKEKGSEDGDDGGTDGGDESGDESGDEGGDDGGSEEETGGGDDSGEATESLTLDMTTLELNMGTKNTGKIKATVKPSSKKLTWVTSDKYVAKVDKNGNVTAVSPGSCTITVKTNDGKSVKCKVTVKFRGKTFANGDKVFFTDVNSADAIIFCSKGKFAMIDTGTSGKASNVKGYLKDLGVKELEWVIITHFDGDHYGGYSKISASYKIKNVYMKKVILSSRPGYGIVKKAAEKAGTKICIVGDKYNSVKLGNYSFKLYNLTEMTSKYGIKRQNINSIVSLATINGKRALFMGDCTNVGSSMNSSQVKIATKICNELAKKIGKVDIYKVAHHGYNGNREEEIKYYKPNYAISSNSYIRSKAIANRIKKYTGSKNYYLAGTGTVIMNISSSGKVTFQKLPNDT